MIEVYRNFFVGNQHDYEHTVKHEDGWCVVHACKEPYHRQTLGYRTRGAPQSHPEYLIARRGHRLILNLVDANDPAYIPKEIIDAVLEYIHEYLSAGDQVLVHCNQGESRSPSIGLLYLATYTDEIPSRSLEEAEHAFRARYPLYNPKSGIRGFLSQHWQSYCSEQDLMR